ncbi:MAG: hypothetical protein H6581_26510 [Bacteroidia bacterium]|nr:hypothetical protein [Bacteroidia bacterium]
MRKDFIFPLARFRRGFEAQQFEVIYFGPNGLELRQKGKSEVSIPYSELEKLTFTNGHSMLPRALSFLDMGGFSSSNAQFEIQTPKDLYRLTLETGLQFQLGKLQSLFTLLYRMDIPLREQTHNGTRLFLLERTTPEKIAQLVEELKREKG